MKVGWFVGSQEWAFKNLVIELMGAMGGVDHLINHEGDVNVLLAVDQLGQMRPTLSEQMRAKRREEKR